MSETSGQLDFKSVAYLLRNSIKEIRSRFGILQMESQVEKLDITTDPEHPFDNVINSFFPIDSILEFNTTTRLSEDSGSGSGSGSGNLTTHQIVGRYASFSPILNNELKSKYRILPSNACTEIDLNDLHNEQEYRHKVLIVLRGDCTFVDKVTNILNSELDSTAIIIANNEPYKGLITMFSNAFNQDYSLETPIMFITFEDYKLLKSLEKESLVLRITTAYLGSWFTLLMSMVFSPPLLIVIFYCFIVCGQKIKKFQVSRKNAQMVRDLPVYIYNIDHLIKETNFSTYLKATGQTNQIPEIENDNAAAIYESPTSSPNRSTTSVHQFIVGGIDLKNSKVPLQVLFSPEKFFKSYKCSICLEKYIPLKSKVLVLDCKHFFHQYCLSNWLINFRRICPLCNSMLSSSSSVQQQQSNLLAGQEEENYGSTLDLERGDEPSEMSSATEQRREVVASTSIPPPPPPPPSNISTSIFSQHLQSAQRELLGNITLLPPRPLLIARPSTLLNQCNVNSKFDREELSTSIDSGNGK
ncbi:hypothetical protein KGF56_001139 [Candida oxycetoniae]|uniref:RING-type domain-containing protein n=1 Tax=Candida oxycetoniae TaxID=497107 RepID=A0AAI9WZH7_9ASCO|nr:uncharacterized protein KGF56_001139 [Candida oxycetoniae]KAI3405920.2 hypothetical protein KGF56_001139 [Candida oxycetoniae]